jgi:hypothetical protein
MDTLRLADSVWVPAYACTCTSSGVFTIEGATGVEKGPAFAMSLTSAVPVFGRALAGRFSVPARCEVTIDVYDVRGRSVSRIMKKLAEPGTHSFGWDLATASGEKAAPGVYFLRLSSAQGNLTRKIVIAR